MSHYKTILTTRDGFCWPKVFLPQNDCAYSVNVRPTLSHASSRLISWSRPRRYDDDDDAQIYKARPK